MLLHFVFQIHEEEEEGGVLVFLPGQEDIEGLRDLLLNYSKSCGAAAGEENALEGAEANDLREDDAADAGDQISKRSKYGVGPAQFVVYTLYAAMPPEQQLRAFETPPPGFRKFVLATNIAETSVTIPGIKYVVDPGLAKMRSLQTGTGVDMLKICAISQSQANQRTGRAGRECQGKCFRLFQEIEMGKLPQTSIPEIQRISISQVLLQLMCMGVTEVMSFPFPSPPSEATVKKGLEQLLLLGALGKVKYLLRWR